MDEPTTALDVVVQREILDEIERLREELGFSVIFITHDLSLLLEISDRLAVMYAGRGDRAGARPSWSPRRPRTRTRWACCGPSRTCAAPAASCAASRAARPTCATTFAGCPFGPAATTRSGPARTVHPVLRARPPGRPGPGEAWVRRSATGRSPATCTIPAAPGRAGPPRRAAARAARARTSARGRPGRDTGADRSERGTEVTRDRAAGHRPDRRVRPARRGELPGGGQPVLHPAGRADAGPGRRERQRQVHRGPGPGPAAEAGGRRDPAGRPARRPPRPRRCAPTGTRCSWSSRTRSPRSTRCTPSGYHLARPLLLPPGPPARRGRWTGPCRTCSARST